MEHTHKLVVMLLAVVLTAVPAGAAVRTWDGGGTNSYWYTPANWNPDGYSTSDDLIVLSGSPTSSVDVKADNGGSITLDGSAAVANFSANLYIAYYPDASRLDVLNGADVSNVYGYLGYLSGASGTATVSGAGSTWTNSGELHVGYNGTGTLSITDGGAVSNTAGYMGRSSGSSGTATVSGAGSTWNNSSSLSVGDSGMGTMSITVGGSVSNTAGYVGRYSGASGTVTISGAGSTWTNSDILYVGRYGMGALNITDGGAVSNTIGYLGRYSGASGTVTVSGVGSAWNNSGELRVGDEGTGALSITDGGAVSNTTGYLGYNSIGSGDVTVSGAGSTWINSNSLYVGRYGTGALSITAGGAVSNTFGCVGLYGGSSGDVTVSGAGSTWINSDLFVGNSGTGVLTVRDGGSVSVAATLRIGQNSGSDGTVNLEGGSLTAEAIVAGAGSAAFNWTGGTLGITGTSGLTLDGGLLGTTVNIHAGKGLDVAAATTVNSGVKLAVTGGTFSTDSLTVNGKAELRSGVINIHDTFTVNINGDLEIAGQDLVLANAPTLNSGSELILDGTTITTPLLTLSSGASINLDSGKISVDETFANLGVLVMGNTGAATIRADLLVNNGVVMGKGTIQAEVENSGNMGFSGDAFFTKDVQNDTGSLLAISGGAGATFYEDVTNNGELRVGVGCTATYYGSISGTGSFTGTGTSYIDGDMMPGSSPGQMSFGGDVVFGWAASLEAELAGTTPGSGHDQMVVTGSAELAGTLKLSLIGGYIPDYYDEFEILTAGSVSGVFDLITGGGMIAPNKCLVTVYNTGNITLVAAIPGDANLNNGVVDDSDLNLLLTGWYSGATPGTTWQEGDFNDDLVVDDSDLNLLLSNWTYPPAGSPVPEPASATILLLGAIVVFRRRQK